MAVVSDQPRTAGRWWVLFAVTVAGVLAPLVGHGCHGDDVDHEPTVPPPVYNQE
jgi:hypothetical protein